MLGVVAEIVLQFSPHGNCFQDRFLELSYYLFGYGVGDLSGNCSRAFSEIGLSLIRGIILGIGEKGSDSGSFGQPS